MLLSWGLSPPGWSALTSGAWCCRLLIIARLFLSWCEIPGNLGKFRVLLARPGSVDGVTGAKICYQH